MAQRRERESSFSVTTVTSWKETERECACPRENGRAAFQPAQVRMCLPGFRILSNFSSTNFSRMHKTCQVCMRNIFGLEKLHNFIKPL